MITIVFHQADEVVVEATRVLRELSWHGLLNDIALVAIGGDPSPGQPPATCVRAGNETPMGLHDALAGADPPTGGRLHMTAVASTRLASPAQLALADAFADIAHRVAKLAGDVVVVPSCLAVPESRDDHSMLPAEGFFTARTVNFVALPTDWQFATGMAAGIDFADTHRASWHAALEIATLTSSWRAVTDSPWRPEIRAPGIDGYAYRFVRSSARLVLIRRHELVAEDFLPVAEGFSPTPVPERIKETVEALHPDAFRLESQVGRSGASVGRSPIMKTIGAALGRIFPPMAAGFRGLGRQLKAEFSEAFGGVVGSSRREQPSASSTASTGASGTSSASSSGTAFSSSGDPVDENPATVSWRGTRYASSSTDRADEVPVVLRGFDPRVWTNLVRNVLGVADGARTEDAVKARKEAGNQEYVFVTPESLVDDLLEERIRSGGQRSQAATALDEAPADSVLDEEAEDAPEAPADAVLDGDTEEDPEAPADAVLDEEAEHQDRPKALLTLLDDAFCDEIDKAEVRQRNLQAKLEGRLEEEMEATERFTPSTALLVTVMAFFTTAYTVMASYVLLLDVFDLDDVSHVLRTRLVLVVSAFTWLVLLYPRIPKSDDDPGAGQSFFLRSTAIVFGYTALAIVFAGPLSELSASSPEPELVPLVLMTITLWLSWQLLSSGKSQERPASRALALVWTVCYLIAGILVYAKLDSSIFNRWEFLRNFFERYGESIRYAAIGVAGLLCMLALVMMVVSDRGNEGRRRRLRAEIRDLRDELRHQEVVPLLRGLRTNWLGTAAALDYILRRNVPTESASDDAPGMLDSPLFRLAVRYRGVFGPPPPPGWLGAQYEAVVDANSRRDARLGTADPDRPETSTMVSPMKRDLLAAPGPDPRWELARRLRSGEFDDALARDWEATEEGWPEDADVGLLSEIVPMVPSKLPVGLVGGSTAALDRVEMDSIWWWPYGLEEPDYDPKSTPDPKLAEVVRSPDEDSYLAVRLDVSHPILEDRIIDRSTSPEDPDDEDPPPPGPATGLG